MSKTKHEANVVIKARDEASRKLRGIGMSFSSMLKTAAGLAGAYMSAKAISGFAKSSVNAFMVQEAAVQKLKDSLGTLGAQDQLAGMQSFAAELQQITTMGDEATMEIMALGASMGGMTGDTLKAATQAAIGFSRAYGMDVKAAMTLVSKAAQGNTASMSRYGITFEEGMTQQEKFQFVLKKGAEGMAIARGETETARGKLQQLSNAWGDFKEVVGGVLARYIPGITDGFKSIIGVIQNWKISFELAYKSVQLGLIVLWEELKHTFTVAIPTVLSWFSENWKDVFIDIWNGTKTVFSNIWENMKNLWTAIVGLLKGEGFNFQWTGLLEGFKSTIKEMPKIAAREMTGLEKELASETLGLQSALAQALTGQPNSTFNPATLAATAAVAAANTNATSSTQKPLQAQEVRFLSGQKANPQEKTNKLLEKIDKTLLKTLDLARVNRAGQTLLTTELT